ncbi:hypothetical protein DMC30DRAFT_375637 [Rhodotorula diobovata]|uniref:Calcineurin-like phosphoesterase domain-containing protein n=1 Tax=Rhodotorula diobovata TaxID=5288 RepID=A0A5C5G0Q0_9BASI|nr:hypothetical protein DMC30DRAFT_375637 [Rhodotorula diobovata]
MVGLHRRGSSAALYVPVHGEPGDITESFSSANRLARTRTGSLTADNTRPAKGELEELEEKESFIPTTRYERPGAAGALGWRDASGRTSRSGRGCGWKGKLVLLVVLGGAIGGAAWFAFFRPESLQEDTWLEAYKPGWWRASLSSVAAEAEATAYGVATGLEANVAWDTATGARDDAYGTATSKWAQASQAAYKGSYNSDGDDYADGDDSDLGDESSELPASSYKDAAVAGVFSAAASELVSTLLDNGTLAAYKWHETLAPLGSAHSKASEGRLLVVGDLHGTHRSLVALLKRLSFSPSSDTLLHVGDLVGKSALNDSLATVSLLRKLGARGVRGNHDQRVLEWRKWMEATFTPVTVYDSTGALLGPSYAHLDPSLTPSQLSSLGLVVPDGWEWGGDHFEIARHLSSADVAYLEQLPLTLWVDELRSYVVHAGMVPWSSLDRVLSRDSTRTALVLEKLNTSPSTLLDMRTLAPAGGRKGGDWTVSAKGRKAGKGAVPWWGVWEEGMRECAQRRGCDEVGVLYGHWAGQGLQVQDHSIGLDSGCVYGRRLSALVVPLSSASSPSSSSGPLSPASSAGASSLTSSGKGATPSVSNASSSSTVEAKKHKVKPHSSSSSASSPSPSASSSAEPGATHPDSNSKAKPNWHGGRQRVKGSAAAALASEDVASSATSTRTGPSPSTSTTGRTHASALVDGPSFSDLDPAPSSSSSSAGYDEDEALIVNDDDDAAEADTKPWWRPWKRAYPQGRPGVAPWSGADRSDAAEGEGKEEGEEGAAASPTAARLTAKAKAEALAAQQDGDAFAEDDDAAEAQEVAELIEADDEAEDGGDDDDWASPESAFAQERVVLAAAGPGGKVAWVVSVDCAAEADIE